MQAHKHAYVFNPPIFFISVSFPVTYEHKDDARTNLENLHIIQKRSLALLLAWWIMSYVLATKCSVLTRVSRYTVKILAPQNMQWSQIFIEQNKYETINGKM